MITLPEEIRPGLFRLEIPLPNNPLKTLNSYVITGPERNLVVDTGFNRPECLAAMRAGLQELAVDLARTDFFITHLHADHSGLAATLATVTSRVMCSAVDAHDINRVVALTPSDSY
ncbi:MAG TPA: MBL fold metallo-hydrolase, partial [Negativicutes bacterium]|nr:MBL fold metallo-hydrolase [Negativicutes bacterium]